MKAKISTKDIRFINWWNTMHFRRLTSGNCTFMTPRGMQLVATSIDARVKWNNRKKCALRILKNIAICRQSYFRCDMRIIMFYEIATAILSCSLLLCICLHRIQEQWLCMVNQIDSCPWCLTEIAIQFGNLKLNTRMTKADRIAAIFEW